MSVADSCQRKGCSGTIVDGACDTCGRPPAGKSLLFDRAFHQRSPFVYKTDLYFASNEVPDEKLAKLRNFDIYKKAGMQAPIPVLGICEKTDEMHPWITPAGKEFYFSRKTEDGWKLFVAVGPVPGPVGKAKEVGFGGTKIKVGRPHVAEDVRRLSAVREKVGFAWEIMTDANQGLTLDEAIRRARHYEALDVAWFLSRFLAALE